MRVNKLVYVYVEETLGSTSSVTGSISMTLPITASRIQAIPIHRARLDDTGTAVYWATSAPTSASAVAVYGETANSTYVGVAIISSTVPFTWTTTDKFQLAFVYEAA
jgi:hypothetical protein